MDNRRCFVQCRRDRWEPPNGRYATTDYNWRLGTALYVCHTYATNNYTAAANSDVPFAEGLVGYMKSRGPSADAIRNPITDVPNLVNWARQLDINMAISVKAISN